MIIIIIIIIIIIVIVIVIVIIMVVITETFDRIVPSKPNQAMWLEARCEQHQRMEVQITLAYRDPISPRHECFHPQNGGGLVREIPEHFREIPYKFQDKSRWKVKYDSIWPEAVDATLGFVSGNVNMGLLNIECNLIMIYPPGN